MNNRLLIRASAGSGKTFRLSGHYLRQLFLGAQPHAILATTFTRKAAGEILGRVLVRLAEAAASNVAAAQLAEFLALPEVTRDSALRVLTGLTHQLHRVRVCTLDSFFQQLARSLTLELGLPGGWSIVDEWVEADLQQQAIDAVLSGHGTREARDLMFRLEKDRGRRSVRESIARAVETFYAIFLLTEREAWNVSGGGQLLRDEDRDAAVAALAQYDLTEKASLRKARDSDLDRFSGGSWDEFLAKGIATKVAQNAAQFSRQEIPDELRACYTPLVNHATAEIVRQLASQNAAVWDLTSRYHKEYSKLQQDHALLRFSDVTRALARAEMPVEAERIAFRLDQSISHLLLDEFQDTSPDQWRILRSLTETLVQGDPSNTFFCVGDPKQAIYGWRGGEAAILDAVEATVPELAHEPLDKSRRSSPVVIEAVNRIFRGIMDHPNLEDYQAACRTWVSAFPDHDTALEDSPGYVRLATSGSLEDANAEQRAAHHRSWVAEQIRQLTRQHPHLQIGVLTRRNKTVAALVHALTALGVSASEEGGTPPTDSPAVLAVMSLLHFASHPGCTTSRFHVARSPLAPVVGLGNWRDDAVAEAVAAQIRAQLLDEGYGPTLQSWRMTVAACCNARDRLRLEQIVSAGWQFDDNPSLNPDDFVSLLESRRFSSADEAPVRVMTIHQSKGLEFDVVILPELDGRIVQTPDIAVGRSAPGSPPDRVCVWRSRQSREVLAASLQAAFQQTADRQISEALCVLYVALTRAQHAVHLLIPPFDSKKPPKSYSGLLVSALTDDLQAPPGQTLFELGDPEWFRALPAPDPANAASPTPQATHHKLRLQPMPNGRSRGLRRYAPSHHEAPQLFSTRKRQSGPTVANTVDPRIRGTVVHTWLETIDWLDAEETPGRDALEQAVQSLGVPQSAMDELWDEFTGYLQQESIRNLLTSSIALQELSSLLPAASRSSNDAALRTFPERPFAIIRDGALIQGSIDRLVLLQRGSTVVAADIIDFKTDRPSGRRSGWLSERVTHYTPQLNEYRAAVMQMYQLPVESVSARLCFLSTGDVIPVTEGQDRKGRGS